MSVSQIVAGNQASVTDNTTRYCSLAGTLASANATEANVETPVRDAGVFSKLYTWVVQNDVGASSTITLRKSRVDTALLVTYTSSQTGLKENTSDTASFAATDEADYEITVPSVPGTHTFTAEVIAVIFTPTTTTDCVSFMVGADGAGTVFSTASTTTFNRPCGTCSLDATEANVQFRIRAACVAQDFYVFVSANLRTTDTVIGTRKNGANGGQSVTYTSTQTGAKEDTSGTDTLAAGDDYNYQLTTLTGTQAITVQNMSSTLVSTSSVFFCLNGNLGTAQAFNLTRYGILGGSVQINTATVENRTQVLARFTWTAKELGAYVSANTIATSASTITFRDNAVDGAQVLSYAAAQTGLKNDSVNTDTITADTDAASYKIVTPNTSGSITIQWISVLGSTPQPPIQPVGMCGRQAVHRAASY